MLHRLREAAALNLRCRDIFESGLPRTYPTTRRLALCPCLFFFFFFGTRRQDNA